MKLTEKEEKIARLALDPAAKDGERASAAKKLIESLMARGVSVEDIQESGMQTGDAYFDSAPKPPAWDGWTGYRTAEEYANSAPGRDARNWRRNYYEPSPTPEEAAEEAAYAEARERQEKAEEERRERAAREALAREQARIAKEAAWPLYTKLAMGLGRFLGPYSKYSWYRMSNPGQNGAFEETANLIFGFVLLVLLVMLLICGIVALFQFYPVVCLLGLVFLFLGFTCYLRSRVD